MNRPICLLATLLAILLAAPLAPAGAAPKKAPSEEVLHDNIWIEGNFAVSSQDFNDDYYDSEAADDFRVPRETWTITKIAVKGELRHPVHPSLARLRRLVVHIYVNDSELSRPLLTLPGATRVVEFADNRTGDATIDLADNPIVLDRGHYWLSVRAHQDELVDGQWFWRSRYAHDFNPAVWRNPYNGFAIAGCTQWSTFDACFSSSPYDDLSWRLHGFAQ